MRIYSDPSRSTETYTMPDVEVWYHEHQAKNLRRQNPNEGNGPHDYCVFPSETDPDQAYPECYGTGFYFWYCMPGCLPDSEPFGPYETEEEAISAAQELAS